MDRRPRPTGHGRRAARSAGALLAVLLLSGACGDATAPDTAPKPTATTRIPPTLPVTSLAPPTVPAPPDRGDVPDGLDLATVTVGGESWLVAVADSTTERRRGLMFVTDLGDLEGMLFVFPSDSAGGFWMKDTLIPLEVAFFRADGSLVDVLAMEPCREDPCRSYAPEGSYRYALEAVPGPLGSLPASATLEPAAG